MPAAIDWTDDTARQFFTSRVARRLTEDDPRRAFFIDQDCQTAAGFVPVLVYENEPGYYAMTGDTEDGTWVWGQTQQEAEQVMDLVNAELFDLDRDAALAVVFASMDLQDELEGTHLDDDDEEDEPTPEPNRQPS